METPPTSPAYILPDDDPRDIRPAFYQDAQDEGFDVTGLSQLGQSNSTAGRDQKNVRKLSKKHRKKRCFLKHYHNQEQSFVLKSAPKKGRYLVKIQILDLEPPITYDPKEDNIMLCAQYVVEDEVDAIMDQTEGLISNISKKLCGYSYSCF